jgi:ferredoxin--NADP+ reductase
MAEQATIGDPVLPEAEMHLVPPTKPVTGRLVESYLCTGRSNSFTRHVSIDVSGTPLAGNFLVGQSFGVIPPGVDKNGKPHQVRLYSIASPTWGEDGQGNVLSTTVKRVIDEYKPQKPADDPEDHSLFLGVCSNYLCDIKIGAEVKVTGPAGKRFLLPVNTADHDYLFIATGTGIAPFRGMVLELLKNPKGPCPSEIHLVMGSPYTTDLMYDDLFRSLAREHHNFHYHVAISREMRQDGRKGLYVHHMIDERIDHFGMLLRSPRTLIYICGLLGMQTGLFQVLACQGLGESYMTVKPELANVDPRDWKPEQIKRYIKQTHRCMVEVY